MNLTAEAKGDLNKAFKHLAEKCDIDFIINNHVLIQNSGALQIPKNMRQIINIYANQAQEAESSAASLDLTPDFAGTGRAIDILKTIHNYEIFRNLGYSVGIVDLPSVPSMEPLVSRMHNHPKYLVRMEVLNGLFELKPNDPLTEQVTMKIQPVNLQFWT
jgi:hypothetical protein